MDNQTASKILELMAIDLTGLLAGLPRRNPMVSVIEQRIEAINTAKKALADDHKDRPHGEWNGGYSIYSDGEWVYSTPSCSVCGSKSNGGTTKYCPNCGAKMDGGET